MRTDVLCASLGEKKKPKEAQKDRKYTEFVTFDSNSTSECEVPFPPFISHLVLANDGN